MRSALRTNSGGLARNSERSISAAREKRSSSRAPCRTGVTDAAPGNRKERRVRSGREPIDSDAFVAAGGRSALETASTVIGVAVGVSAIRVLASPCVSVA